MIGNEFWGLSEMFEITHADNKKTSTVWQMRSEVSIVFLRYTTLPTMALSNRSKGQRSGLTLSELLPWFIYKAMKRLYDTLLVECYRRRGKMSRNTAKKY